MKKMTAIVALVAVFTLAICLIILGSISIELMEALEIDSGQFGTLVTALFFTSCIVQLITGPVVDKIGHKPVAVIGFAAVSISMIMLALASSFSAALAACIILGIGAMSVNTVGNTLIPVVLFEGKDPARASNFGNGFFGLGYILIPLLIVFIIKTLGLSYHTALIIIAVLCILFMILALMTSFPVASTGFKFNMAVKLLLNPAVIIAALAMFCYTSLESSVTTWIKNLMEELFSISSNTDASAKAGVVLSFFGVAMMAGRFLLSSIKNMTAIGTKVIIFSTILAILSIILMIVAKGPVVGIIGVILAGIAFAPIFPTIIGVTFSKFEPGLYGSIFGIVFATGLLGGTFIPKLIGNLSVGSTVQQSLSVALFISLALLVISFFIARVNK
ncbi:MAG TPA: MFS transporter [Bacteroidales bacterium]|jgi:FHS family glucose/mannose:H+ symporter-like MFS transporter|nr:MFS transporter [Bacteroidales bacterium]HNY53076.1 MFS transporter [Bacteroidales bacterium]HOG56527.1 MFS transporter [Bacteroidales bacterium]